MAVQTYTAKAAVKARLGITDTTDDTLLDTICGEVNDWLEGRIGFPVGPITSEIRLFDGHVVRHERGYAVLPCYPFGVRAVTAIRTASGTGETLTAQTASDVLIRPADYARETGWPGFELWVKDTADWSWTTSGLDVNEVTATWGWAAIPPELKSIADRVAIAAFRARGFGTGSQYTVGDSLDTVAAEELTATDWRTVNKYHFLKPGSLVG